MTVHYTEATLTGGEATGEQTPAASDNNAGADSLMAEFEKVASAALTNAEKFIRENPVTAAVGIGAAGALIALAISRRSQAQPLDRRLMNELNRHSADVVRAVRQNANTFANSDTANAITSFAETLANRLSKVPGQVSDKVSEMTKS